MELSSRYYELVPRGAGTTEVARPIENEANLAKEFEQLLNLTEVGKKRTCDAFDHFKRYVDRDSGFVDSNLSCLQKDASQQHFGSYQLCSLIPEIWVRLQASVGVRTTLAAQHQRKKENPLDYCVRCMGIAFEQVPSSKI